MAGISGEQFAQEAQRIRQRFDTEMYNLTGRLGMGSASSGSTNKAGKKAAKKKGGGGARQAAQPTTEESSGGGDPGTEPEKKGRGRPAGSTNKNKK